MESRLVSRRNEIQNELRLMRYGSGRRDPRRQDALEATLRGIERDIKAMGFSEAEIARNNFAYGGDRRGIQRQFLIDPTGIASGGSSDTKDTSSQNVPNNTVRTTSLRKSGR
jgi:hypothetical protein